MKRLLSALALLIAALLAPLAAAQGFDTLARTPPMGWNSWNHFGCSIDEALIRRTADAMVTNGMRDAGYVYVNIDDCWQGERDANGFIQPDAQRFPAGMKALADYVHGRGMKLGIYSDAGAKTCGGRAGSQGHEYQDALQYARWGVDYLKYDWCSTGTGAGQRNAREAYATMRDALRAAGRPIVLSICEWGDNQPWLWGEGVGQLWRTTGDITNCWNCRVDHGGWASNGVLPILDKQDGLRKYAGVGHWNDPDMLEVGNMATAAEDRSHFALWAMLAAPLIVGTDVEKLSPATHAVLTNPRLVAIDQDALGIGAFTWLRTPTIEVWARPLANDRWAVAVLNRGDARASYSLDWRHDSLSDQLSGRDAKLSERRHTLVDQWSGVAAGDTSKPLRINLAPHDTAVFVLTPAG